MKILQLAKYPPTSSGGIEKLTSQYSKDLFNDQTRLDILCFQEHSKSRFEIYNSHTVYRARTLLKLFSVPISIHNLYFLKKVIENYEIIHLHLPNPLSIIYTLLTIKPWQKLSIHYHADVSHKFGSFLYDSLLKRILRRANGIIFTSNSLANTLDLSDVSLTRKIIPLYLSKSDFKEPYIDIIDDSLVKLSERKNILFVGRLVKYKCVDKLIKSFKKLIEKHDDINLILLGSGVESGRINNLITKLGLCEKIYSITNADDNTKKLFLSKAEFLVLPSTTPEEAFGYVQLEAMAFCTPVISFQIPRSGVSEINIDGKTGICLPISSNDDSQVLSLSSAMDILLSNKDMRDNYSVNCKKHASKFLSEKIIPDIQNYFDNLFKSNIN
tara:strand:+ start:1438 stop:2589 length:1152 start_codon:yes stop_codon:yes gene_type:complete